MAYRSSLLDGWTVWVAGIFALTLVVYGMALDNFFVPFDDNTLIYLNPAVEHFSFATIRYIFTSYDPELYIPLTLFAYQLLHLMFGFTPAAFHAMSLLLHLVNIGLVAWILWQLTQNRGITLAVAVLFAIHPMQSEAVLWAAALKDVLSAALGLLSLGLYLRWRETSERKFFQWCIVCFFLGLLAKVSIAPLPIIFLLIDWLQGRLPDRRAWTEKWPLYLLAGVFIVIAIAGKTAVIGNAGFLVTGLLSFKATAFYLWKLVWPTHLSLLYPQRLFPVLQSPVILASIAVVIALLGIAYASRRRFRFVTFGILWYLLFLAPSFSNFYKNEYLYYASDRYAYLPFIGLFFIIATVANVLWERLPRLRIASILIAVCIIVMLASITHGQVRIWKDAKTLFAHVIAEYPDAVIAYNNYGAEFDNDETAFENYKKAIALDPDFILAYRNIANYYYKKGDMDNVNAIYEKALSVIDHKPHPTHDDIVYIYFAYAEHLDEAGNRARAMELFKKAATLVPDFSEAHYNLGIKYEKYGQLDLALPELQRAVELDDMNTDALYHLASVHASRGQLQEAATRLEELLTIDPKYPNAQRHLDQIRTMVQ